jgi:two-component system CheB/CheR fusion protein
MNQDLQEQQDSEETAPPRESEPDEVARSGRFPIVGLGASAGGIEALERFFAQVPLDLGVAFLVVLHLGPDTTSHATEILARVAKVPVQEAEDGDVVEPDHVYVITPNTVLGISNGRLDVKRPADPRRQPVDALFRALAEDQGDAAVGVVLSGTGSDGAAGLKAIKDHGGMAIAQLPEEAGHPGMPRSAVALGFVDWILPVEEIPARLAEYAKRRQSLDSPRGPFGLRAEDAMQAFRTIAALILRATGHDFSQYKQSTMFRRIQRRVQVTQSESLAAYVDFLRHDPEEITLLFNDLLINVTCFFRDPPVFEALAGGHLASLLASRGGGRQVRVWVPGCSSGEEAYTIAMLMREAMSGLDAPPSVKIFATDIDDQALDLARQGLYPESIAEDVSPARLERFFHKQRGGYQVQKDIREMCVFSTHNVISDPPFSRLDLISCRNLLIYLETELQKKLVPLFHYALVTGGHLLLGPSENLAGHPDLFLAVDKQRRLFERKEATISPLLIFPLLGASRVARLGSDLSALRPPTREQNVTRSFERVLLDEYAPAAVIVNPRCEIVYVSGRTGRYLELPSGATSTNVVDMAHPNLRPDLHAALHKAIRLRQPVLHEAVVYEATGVARRLNLVVRPMFEGGAESELFMLIFEEITTSFDTEKVGIDHLSTTRSHLAADLEKELRSTREHLQATNEELQSANEEMLSTNEELQSTNEELQTSKEELQSINEELQTVNLELTRNVEELDGTNNDLQNLFASTHIATMFLGADLRIKKFSPATTEVFRVIDSDIGRPVTDIAATFTDAELITDVRAVLSSLVPREQKVYRGEGDRWYIRRVQPYRSVNNVIDGVVITFVDITELQRAQDRIAGLAAIVESSQDAIVGFSIGGRIQSWNVGAERMYGYAAADVTGRPFAQLFPPDRGEALDADYARVARGEHVVVEEISSMRKDGVLVPILLTLSPVYDSAGRVIAVASIAHDLTRIKDTERELRRGEERLRLALESTTLGTWEFDPTSGAMSWSDRARVLWGFAPDAPITYDSVLLHVLEADQARLDETLRRALEPAGPGEYEVEIQVLAADGSTRWVGAWGRAFFAESGGFRRAVRLIGTLLDITERRRTEEALKAADRHKNDFLAVLGHELRNPLTPIRNAVHVLRRLGTADAVKGRAHEMIERQLHHMTRLIDDLLDISRVSSGKVVLRREHLDLVDLVRCVIEDERSDAEAGRLSLEANLPTQPLWILGDATRLAQSVSNLLINAVKFTSPGGRILIDLITEADGAATIRVGDTGMGVEPELMDRLFQPFMQADRSIDRSRGGLGLGLSLVKSFVELHGGQVEVHSDGAGHGSVFSIHLPVEQQAAPSQPTPVVPSGPRRILVIEDNIDAAESMQIMLELSGHTVAVAWSGPEGLTLARTFLPELVLCDIGLPGQLDGYDVARALVADPTLAGARRVAISGYGQEEDRQRAREAGFEEHLVKPVDPDALVHLIDRLFSRSGRRRTSTQPASGRSG